MCDESVGNEMHVRVTGSWIGWPWDGFVPERIMDIIDRGRLSEHMGLVICAMVSDCMLDTSESSPNPKALTGGATTSN